MKNIYPLIILLFLSKVGIGQALSTSVPLAGDTFNYLLSSNPFKIPSKVNGVFDFSQLASSTNLTSDWIYEKANSPLYPAANLLFNQSDLAASQTFFNSKNGKLYIVALNNLPLPPQITITQNLRGSLVYMTYPFDLSTKSNTNDSINAVVALDSNLLGGFNIDSLLTQFNPIPIPGVTLHADSLYFSLNFNLELSADQSGKITTPKDTALDCIRIVRKLTFTPDATIGVQITTPIGTKIYRKIPLNSIDSTITPDASFLNQTQHLYYSPKYKSEVVQGTLDSLGQQYNTVYYRNRSVKDTMKPKDTIRNSISQNINTPLQFSWTDNNINIFGKKTNELISIQIYDMMGRKKVEKTIRGNTLYIEDLEKNQLYIIRYRYLEQEGALKLMH